MSINKINSKRDFIPYENENGRYQIDTNSRKKCYIIKINYEEFPISKDLLKTLVYITSGKDKYKEFNIKLDTIGILNCQIIADTYEELILKILQKLVEILQTNSSSIIRLKETVNLIKNESSKIIET